MKRNHNISLIDTHVLRGLSAALKFRCRWLFLESLKRFEKKLLSQSLPVKMYARAGAHFDYSVKSPSIKFRTLVAFNIILYRALLQFPPLLSANNDKG